MFLYEYSYVIIFVTAFFIASFVLTQKTRDLRKRNLKEVRFLDVPLVLTLFVLSTFNFLVVLKEATLPLEVALYVVVSTILLIWYIILIVYSKHLNAKEKGETDSTNS